MFNLKSGISIFEQIMLVCLKSNKPGPNIGGPTHLKLVVKGFLQTSSSNIATISPHNGFNCSRSTSLHLVGRKWWNVFARMKTRSLIPLRCALGKPAYTMSAINYNRAGTCTAWHLSGGSLSASRTNTQIQLVMKCHKDLTYAISSVTRDSSSDVGHWLTDWLSHLTDVTLVSDDTYVM